MNDPGQELSQRLLADLDLRILAVQRTEARSWWNYRNVVSPFSRLWLVLDGQAGVTHHGRRFRLVPGRMHLVPAFTRHDCRCARRLDHYHLHFTARLSTGIDLLSLLECEYESRVEESLTGFFQRLEAIYPDRKLPCYDPFQEEYRQFPARLEQRNEPPAADWIEAQGLLRILLAPFLRTARVHEGMHARAASRFLAVQEHIQEHMRAPVTLADMARVAGLNPTYFSDRFLQLVGVRPLEYLARRRIERAQELLLATQASVKAVAGEVGMNDPAHFTRVFSKYCQMSPTAYRASHQDPRPSAGLRRPAAPGPNL